jgi:ribosome biogenesis GTPase / thiamine phosphate phosphatase
MKGRVFKSTGSWYQVRLEGGQKVACRLRGKFKVKGLKVTNPIAVGDYVEVETESGTDDNTAVITNILSRENYILRKSTHKASHGHMLAANIDQAAVIVTLAYPRTSLGFIDRFLVTAETFRIPTCIIFNKKDILEPAGLEMQAEVMDIYDSIGYQTLEICAFDTQDINQVKEFLRGKTTLVSGHSGVGKSTLINKIIPGAELKTAEVSDFANKGVHTTTFAEMFAANEQTYIIDSPGIKELGLIDIEEDELGHYFPEFRERLGACKFHNCRHLQEPGCAIRQAVEADEIPYSRYHSYLSMLEGGDNRR